MGPSLERPIQDYRVLIPDTMPPAKRIDLMLMNGIDDFARQKRRPFA
jgi:hypothetical protein